LKFDKVDITKSKKKNRLIRRTWFVELVLDYTLYLIFIAILPFLTGTYFFERIEIGEKIFISSLLFGITLLISVFMICTIVNLDKLNRIKGVLKDENRQIIELIADKFNWIVQTNNERIIVLTIPWNLLSSDWGRKITVIYDKKDILVNITSYGMNNLKSPFHWFTNRKLEKKLIENFKVEIKKRHANNSYK
jgi:hypothetical protein